MAKKAPAPKKPAKADQPETESHVYNFRTRNNLKRGGKKAKGC
jgi:hypothetical protein